MDAVNEEDSRWRFCSIVAVIGRARETVISDATGGCIEVLSFGQQSAKG